MRGVLVLVTVAACYRAAPDRCEVTVGNPACQGDDGAAGDTPGDQPVEQPVCTVPPSAIGEHNIVDGTWLAARLDGDRFAIMSLRTQDANQVLRFSIVGTQDNLLVTPQFSVIVQGDMFVEYQSPRLSYDGLELFARADKSNVHEIVHSTRTPATATWSVPAPLVFRDGNGTPENIMAGVDPSPPTETSPRRMLLVFGTTGFEEYVEDKATGEWDVKRVHAYAFDPPFAGQAQLSSDGLQLIYVSSGKVYVSVRPNLASDFATTATPVATALTSFRPFLFADCKHLLYDDGSIMRLVDY